MQAIAARNLSERFVLLNGCDWRRAMSLRGLCSPLLVTHLVRAAVEAVLFVICCVLTFWSFKTKQRRLGQRLRLFVDGLLMIALALMVGICAIIAYALV